MTQWSITSEREGPDEPLLCIEYWARDKCRGEIIKERGWKGEKWGKVCYTFSWRFEQMKWCEKVMVETLTIKAIVCVFKILNMCSFELEKKTEVKIKGRSFEAFSVGLKRWRKWDIQMTETLVAKTKKYLLFRCLICRTWNTLTFLVLKSLQFENDKAKTEELNYLRNT